MKKREENVNETPSNEKKKFWVIEIPEGEERKKGATNLLKGRIDESSSLEKTIYDTNVAAIKEAFGPNWQTVCTTNSNRIYCSEGDLNVDAYTTGEVLPEELHGVVILKKMVMLIVLASYIS